MRRRVTAAAVALGWVTVVVVTLVVQGVRVRRDLLAASWQLLPADQLASDPIGSVWNLHIQPPLHNATIGAVLAWSPFPAMGTVFALYLVALGATAVLLADVLVAWRVPPVAAGTATGLALANPNLLSTIEVASYEIPVTMLLVGSLWWIQRCVQRPSGRALVGLAVTLTALALMRSLFHPVFVVGLIVAVGLVRRASWRQIAIAAAIPVVLIGGWMAKNQVLFGTPTLSSWLGFNLQRGVAAPMERSAVEDAVADGAVSSLALEYPWGTLDRYADRVGDCVPDRRHPVVTIETREKLGGFDIANFNHQCYLPLYEQSQTDALALIRREPGRYLSTRLIVLRSSFAMTEVGVADTTFSVPGRDLPDRTWMDGAGDVLLLPIDTEIDMEDWNLPLLLGGPLPMRISLTLLLLASGVVARGGVGLWRSVRTQRGSPWDGDEVVWMAAASFVVMVVVVGDLLEFGENGRFRSMLDPLLVALPLGAAARLIAGRSRWARPRSAGDDVDAHVVGT